MNRAAKSVLVTGASGLLGVQLVKQLCGHDYKLTAVGRGRCPNDIQGNVNWRQADIIQDSLADVNADILIHAAPIWLLPGLLKRVSSTAGIQRCIAFSSTSAESKQNATDSQDRDLARRLMTAEAETKQLCEDNLDYTIFRPTLIYGYGKDENVSVIARFIKKFRFFPVAGKAKGLRQPVHVDDLVRATISVINNDSTFSKVYNLTGGETLNYDAMVVRIFHALNYPVRIIRLPVSWYRLALALRNAEYGSGVADRMNQNLAYNSDAAVADFGYQAQLFLTHPDRDLI